MKRGTPSLVCPPERMTWIGFAAQTLQTYTHTFIHMNITAGKVPVVRKHETAASQRGTTTIGGMHIDFKT